MKLAYLLLLFALAFIFGCKKEDPPKEKSAPKLVYEALFFIKKPCFQDIQDSIQFIDSTLLFINQSWWRALPPDTIPANPDTNQVKTYKWDFGDNTSSTSQHASHVYTLPGTYQVSLVTFLNNVPSDTFSRNVRIIIGQREIKTSYTYTTCVDIEETSGNNILLLLSSFNSYSDPPSYSLMKLDSLLKTVWVKAIPGNNIRLNSLKKATNNEYILSGNYTSGNTDQFAITRINANGDLIWTKYINNLSGKNVHTILTSDGFLLTIGDTTISLNQFPVVVKCSINGDEIWRRSFNTGIGLSVRSPDNIIETSNGYLFAAAKTNSSNSKIILTSLDLNGNIIQQTETDAPNTATIFRTGVVKNGSGYMVYATNTVMLYFFSDILAFSSSSQLPLTTGVNHAVSYNGSYYLAEGNHQYSNIIKLSANGSPTWYAGIGNRIPLSCSSIYSGVTRYCKKVLCTTNDVIALSYGQNNTAVFNSSSVYIEKFNHNDGWIK